MTDMEFEQIVDEINQMFVEFTVKDTDGGFDKTPEIDDSDEQDIIKIKKLKDKDNLDGIDEGDIVAFKTSNGVNIAIARVPQTSDEITLRGGTVISQIKRVNGGQLSARTIINPIYDSNIAELLLNVFDSQTNDVSKYVKNELFDKVCQRQSNSKSQIQKLAERFGKTEQEVLDALQA